MILEVLQSKWSLTWYDPLGPRMCVLELMNGHVLQTLREQLKVPGSRLEGSELLTSEFLRFRSRLNETSGGLEKIGAVSGSDCRILKFLRTAFLAAKLLGWKVSVKGIRSSLSEAGGSKADSLLVSLFSPEIWSALADNGKTTIVIDPVLPHQNTETFRFPTCLAATARRSVKSFPYPVGRTAKTH